MAGVVLMLFVGDPAVGFSVGAVVASIVVGTEEGAEVVMASIDH